VDLPSAVCALLDRPLVAHISTVSPAGRPQASIVWFERRGDEVVLFSRAADPKVRNLLHNPHIEVLVVDPQRELGAGTPGYARLTGTAEVRPAEPGIHHRLARRYGHPDGFPAAYGDVGEIVNIHVAVQRVSGLRASRDVRGGTAGPRVSPTRVKLTTGLLGRVTRHAR
jgi:PPOX class probable F420-dependent enzyme